MTTQKDGNNKDINAKDESLIREQHDEKVLVDDPAVSNRSNPKGSYEGRKHEPEIDGPIEDSQETDEIYADPRKGEDLPAGGKNVGDLNAHDLSQKGNE